MPYGESQRLLKDRDDVVLVESAFEETTRDGLPLASVLLALTNKKLLIISRRVMTTKPRVYYNTLQSQLSLSYVNLSVFKQTHRQVVKALFRNKTVKYYELGTFKKRKIFWDIWRNHIRELNRGPKLWPFKTKLDDRNVTTPVGTSTSTSNSCSSETPQRRWTDKYLYLGSKRERDNAIQPYPEVGITRMTFNSLMQEIVGNCKQSSHWIVNDQDHDGGSDNPVCTYTGEPTSNVTYISILTIMREADDASSKLTETE